MQASWTLALQDVEELPKSSETERRHGLPHLLDDGEDTSHAQTHHLPGGRGGGRRIYIVGIHASISIVSLEEGFAPCTMTVVHHKSI